MSRPAEAVENGYGKHEDETAAAKQGPPRYVGAPSAKEAPDLLHSRARHC